MTNWIFPFSFISINKSVEYTPDKVFVDDYKKSLDNLTNQYNPEDFGQVIILIDETVEFLSDEWLITTDPVSIDLENLDSLEVKVEQIQRNMTDIDNNKNINLDNNAADYLNNLINSFHEIENQITRIKNSNSKTRGKIEHQIYQLHMTLSSEIKGLTAFVTAYQKSQVQDVKG